MKLSVIIPAYNEEQTIVQVVRAVQAVLLPEGITKEIVVVNDGSTDGTAEALAAVANDPGVRVFHQSPNRGKTAGIKRGFFEASGDILLVQDADLEYDPAEYPRLLEPLLNGSSDVVYGSRFLGTIHAMEGVNRWANVLSNLTFNILFGTRITDINTCFKIFKRSALDGVAITTDHFTFETEVTAKLVKRGVRIREVPIHYEARSIRQGKKINWPKALAMYWAIIHFRFSS